MYIIRIVYSSRACGFVDNWSVLISRGIYGGGGLSLPQGWVPPGLLVRTYAWVTCGQERQHLAV